MKYRELLDQCKNKSGCLSTNEQREIESFLNFRTWIDKKNMDNPKKSD